MATLLRGTESVLRFKCPATAAGRFESLRTHEFCQYTQDIWALTGGNLCHMLSLSSNIRNTHIHTMEANHRVKQSIHLFSMNCYLVLFRFTGCWSLSQWSWGERFVSLWVCLFVCVLLILQEIYSTELDQNYVQQTSNHLIRFGAKRVKNCCHGNWKTQNLFLVIRSEPDIIESWD